MTTRLTSMTTRLTSGASPPLNPDQFAINQTNENGKLLSPPPVFDFNVWHSRGPVTQNPWMTLPIKMIGGQTFEHFEQHLQVGDSRYGPFSPPHTFENDTIYGQSYLQFDEDNAGTYFIGGMTITLMIIGILGNIPAFLYFYRKWKRMPDMFYTMITAIDFCTSISMFPVIASLLHNRSPILFENTIICTSWPVFFYLSVRVSMFLVMLMSISRTVALIFPFYDIHRHDNKIYPATLLYSLTLLVIDAVYLIVGELKALFKENLSVCELQIEKAESIEDYSEGAYFYSIILQFTILIPSLLVFASFVSSTAYLLKKKSMQNDGKNKFRKVSITIALFSALFLACNLPCFALQVVYFIALVGNDKRNLIAQDSMLSNYSHLVSVFLLTALNAALNPCFYLLRMPQYRKWLQEVRKDPKKMLSNTGSSINRSATATSTMRSNTATSTLRSSGNAKFKAVALLAKSS